MMYRDWVVMSYLETHQGDYEHAKSNCSCCHRTCRDIPLSRISGIIGECGETFKTCSGRMPHAFDTERIQANDQETGKRCAMCGCTTASTDSDPSTGVGRMIKNHYGM